jgi:hypothetical protein
VNYINANGCTASAPVVKNINVTSGAAPTITGLTNVCVNSGYDTYTTQASMTGYTWTIQGGTINFGQGTYSVMVTWNTPGAQWIKVTYTNANNCSPANPTQLNVTVNPMPGSADDITGTPTVCAGATGIAYSVDPIQNAATYVWSLPAGATIASGTGTNAITVNFAANASSGNITVYGNNVCGNGAVSSPYSVTVTPLPGAAGTIIGPASVCKPSTGNVYTVEDISGATGYVWVVPAGATITSGANTTSITVDFAATAVAGAITVYGTSSCGNGNVSPNLNITFTEPPAAPVITLDGTILTSSVATGNQWYREDVLLTGETGQTLDAATYSLPGYFWDVVMVGNCSSGESNHIQVFPVGINDLTSGNITIYPIPNDGRFTVSIVSPSQETFTLSIFNNLGMKIYEARDIIVNGTLDKVVDLKPVSQGVYSVVLQGGKTNVEKKILVTK